MSRATLATSRCSSASERSSPKSTNPARPAATCSSIFPPSPANTRWRRRHRRGRPAARRGWRRLVVEKPFGHDLASARELSDRLHEVFDESAIFRIDHYLVRNRAEHPGVSLGNGIFEPLWNRRYIITSSHRRRIDRRRRPRRLLPGSRRARRYDPEPPLAGDGHHCHGALRSFRRDQRARRTLQAAALHETHDARRDPPECGGGPVRPGADWRETSPAFARSPASTLLRPPIPTPR